MRLHRWRHMYIIVHHQATERLKVGSMGGIGKVEGHFAIGSFNMLDRSGPTPTSEHARATECVKRCAALFISKLGHGTQETGMPKSSWILRME